MRYVTLVCVTALLSACSPDVSEVSKESGAEVFASLAEANAVQEYYTVSWDSVSDPSVDGYKVHVGLSSREYIVHRDVGRATSAYVYLPKTRAWYVAVTAYNRAGESAFSEEVSVLVDLP